MNFPDSISAEGGVKSGMCLQNVSQGLDYIIKFGSCPRPVKGSPPFPPDKELGCTHRVMLIESGPPGRNGNFQGDIKCI